MTLATTPATGLPTTLGKVQTMRDMLQARLAAFRDVIPRHLSAERLVRVACSAASRQPLLLQCTPASFLQGFMLAAQLGLEPNGPMGHAYLIPYRNGKTGQYEAQFQVGYRGLVDLARRSGQIVSIEAHCVYANEKHRVVYGLETVLEHEPLLSGDRGPFLAVYAVAHLKDGGVQAEVMTLADINAIRKRSRSGDSGPWVTDFGEMARKTVIKRLCKSLPISVELASALEADSASALSADIPDLSFGLDAAAEVTPQEAPVEEPPPKRTRTQQVRDRIRERDGNGDAPAAGDAPDDAAPPPTEPQETDEPDAPKPPDPQPAPQQKSARTRRTF